MPWRGPFAMFGEGVSWTFNEKFIINRGVEKGNDSERIVLNPEQQIVGRARLELGSGRKRCATVYPFS